MLRHIAQRLVQAFLINNHFLRLLILKVTGDITPGVPNLSLTMCPFSISAK